MQGEVLCNIPEIDVYIDDVGIFTNSSDKHCCILYLVLTKLENNGFTINLLKCELGVQETDWLGYWLTPHGLKPWSKKIKAILYLEAPTNLCTFIGAVNFYQNMWPCRAHLLAPLTALTGEHHFEWLAIHQQVFDQLKATIAKDALLHYPDQFTFSYLY